MPPLDRHQHFGQPIELPDDGERGFMMAAPVAPAYRPTHVGSYDPRWDDPSMEPERYHPPIETPIVGSSPSTSGEGPSSSPMPMMTGYAQGSVKRTAIAEENHPASRTYQQENVVSERPSESTVSSTILTSSLPPQEAISTQAAATSVAAPDAPSIGEVSQLSEAAETPAAAVTPEEPQVPRTGSIPEAHEISAAAEPSQASPAATGPSSNPSLKPWQRISA